MKLRKSNESAQPDSHKVGVLKFSNGESMTKCNFQIPTVALYQIPTPILSVLCDLWKTGKDIAV